MRPELLDLDYAEPSLRQLFPWTCDIPYIRPAADSGYWVSGPLRSQAVGPAETAAQAVAMVVERLPTGCGPTFLGTPDELVTHEKAAQRRHSSKTSFLMA
ncbi:DUF6193 family natural product biosynthesis protein [Streptomyces sp. SKN60]|uniref:DUF6193 family natural product biosynthesis protein n=1 Tax=Streptomyces sp. SKN60 TaxID=2855506 RepID=UPI0035AC1F78